MVVTPPPVHIYMYYVLFVCVRTRLTYFLIANADHSAGSVLCTERFGFYRSISKIRNYFRKKKTRIDEVNSSRIFVKK